MYHAAYVSKAIYTFLLICIAKFDQMRIRKIRDTIPSVSGLLELLRRNPNSTTLGTWTITFVMHDIL